MIRADNCERFIRDGKYGIRDKYNRANVLCNAKYDDIKRIKGSNYFLKFLFKNKWGIMTCNDEIIFAPLFDDVQLLHNYEFTVVVNGSLFSKLIPDKYKSYCIPPKRYPDSDIETFVHNGINNPSEMIDYHWSEDCDGWDWSTY